jgi:hypothetical protein
MACISSFVTAAGVHQLEVKVRENHDAGSEGAKLAESSSS